MKKNIYGLLAGAVFLLAGCEKEEIGEFRSGDGLYFTNAISTYNFTENYDHQLLGRDTLNILVSVTGNASETDREFLVEPVKDSLYTAEDGMYELLPGVVKAHEFQGTVPVIIYYSKKLDDSVYVARIKLKGNEYFPDENLFDKNYSVQFSNKISMPENWSRLKSRFGDYSNSWYAFILRTTGLAYIPYWSSPTSTNNPDPKRYWMNYNDLAPYVSQVKVAWTDYNNAHPNDPMLHEDGEKKGKPVIMP